MTNDRDVEALVKESIKSLVSSQYGVSKDDVIVRDFGNNDYNAVILGLWITIDFKLHEVEK